MKKTISKDAQVNFTDGQFYTTTDNITTSLWIDPYTNPTWYRWYPNYYTTSPSKFEQAFKVARVLQEKKLIDIKTIKQFIEVIDELQKVL